MRAVASRIERGLPAWAPLRAAEAVWKRFVQITRPLDVPRHVRVVTVGGATLGGSGKTPVAVAIARQLATAGRRTVLISHAVGATGRVAWVQPSDDASVVGDEAVESAEALAHTGARVASARRRQDAVDLASEWAEVLVIDGPIQISPRPADLAVLALSAEAPWGSRHCPPLGDLRAPKEELLRLANLVVEVRWSLTGARLVDGSRAFGIDELRRMRVGLVTALARPDRVVRTLQEAGVTPAVHAIFGDHAMVDERRLGSHLKSMTDPSLRSGMQRSLKSMTVPSLCSGVRLNSGLDVWLAPTKTRPLWRGAPKASGGTAAAWLSALPSLHPALPRLDLALAYP